MDAILAGITISILRWEEAANKPSNVVYMDEFRRKRWLRTYTRPMPPSGRAA
jgi:hypothetical protein